MLLHHKSEVKHSMRQLYFLKEELFKNNHSLWQQQEANKITAVIIEDGKYSCTIPAAFINEDAQS